MRLVDLCTLTVWLLLLDCCFWLPKGKLKAIAACKMVGFSLLASIIHTGHTKTARCCWRALLVKAFDFATVC